MLTGLPIVLGKGASSQLCFQTERLGCPGPGCINLGTRTAPSLLRLAERWLAPA